MATTSPDHLPARGPSLWAWGALLAAVVGAGGSLYLTLGMDLHPCPLCYYQRTFALSLVAVLAVGLLGGGFPPGRLGVLAFPLALGGLGVAMFHVNLEANGTLECPAGILGLGSAPQQSLAAFVLISVLLLGDALAGIRTRTTSILGGLLAVALGVALAWASCKSNPPLPNPPDKPYDDPPKVCRRPYQG